MKKEMNNKGFSLVELIIVVAIMAVLIGVLAPAYLQYVEKSKKTKDCSAVGSIMDACEILASDPALKWPANSAEAITVNVSDTACTYTCTVSDVVTKLNGIVDESKTRLSGSWGSITFTATKDSDGIVQFSNTSAATAMNEAAIGEISPELEARFQ